MNDFVLAIVEALGIPCRMVAFSSVMEELPGGTVKHVDALCGILYCMGVNDVQKNADSHFMGLVYQIF